MHRGMPSLESLVEDDATVGLLLHISEYFDISILVQLFTKLIKTSKETIDTPSVTYG